MFQRLCEIPNKIQLKSSNNNYELELSDQNIKASQTLICQITDLYFPPLFFFLLKCRNKVIRLIRINYIGNTIHFLDDTNKFRWLWVIIFYLYS